MPQKGCVGDATSAAIRVTETVSGIHSLRAVNSQLGVSQPGQIIEKLILFNLGK